jgi:hypothetical protein
MGADLTASGAKAHATAASKTIRSVSRAGRSACGPKLRRNLR